MYQTRKKHKFILLFLLGLLLLFMPNESLADTKSTAPVIPDKKDQYADFFHRLTLYINQTVGNSITSNSLNNHLDNQKFIKAIAQRELLRKVDVSTIEEFTTTSEKKAFMDWLLDNTEAMNLFLEGGEPESDYVKAFNMWFEIWSKDADSHTGYELKLAIASAMKFGNGVPKWYTSRTLVTPYERYEYYKVREAEGKFPISMKTRTVWELRNTIAAPASNWDLDYVREVIHKDRYKEDKKRVSVRYPPYTSISIHKDENGNPYSVFRSSGDQFFGPDATIKEVHEIGGVCGTASKFGTITNNAFGIPGFNVGQPGHAAHVYHSPNSAGKWDIGYDVSGWGNSNIGSRTNIPYTNYDNAINRVAYWFVYEAARADEEKLHKSYQLKWIADALKEYDNAQAVRKIAMDVNKWNIDIWRDYIKAVRNVWNDAIEDTKIPLNKITATATSSHSNEGPENAIDGKSETIWHTKYGRKRSTLPQSITLSFDKAYEVNRFSYSPRKSGKNGNITEYKLYTSLDGKNYELVAHGNWANNTSTKTVEFTTTKAKHIKLEALKGHNNFATASELKVYQPLKNKPITQEQWDEIAYSIIKDLKEQPVVVYDLFRSIQDLILNSEISREKYQKYIVDLHSILEVADNSNWKEKQIAKSLRKKMPSYGLVMADFSFDGTNAGKLMGSKTDTEYSLDGGETWKPVREENMKLSDKEIASITSENGIRIRIKGTKDYTTIPINKAPSLPNIYENDDINRVFGLNDTIYYSIDKGETWTKFEGVDKLPDLSGDLTFMTKIPAQGKTLGSEIRSFDFSSKEVDSSLILPSDIANIKANADKGNPVKYAYDGNIYSLWHTDFKENIKPLPQGITFELKDMSNLYKLEYVPRQDGGSNGRITEYNIYTSTDGENFNLVSKGKWANDDKTKTAMFNGRKTKYIKLEAVKAERNFASAAEIKLFKSKDLIPHISFHFDGVNSGKLLGANTDMEYSMDGGNKWKDVTEVNMPLPSDDLKRIDSDTTIKVRFKNTKETATIRFTACSKTPHVEGDNTKNTITGLDNTMEYSTDNGATWTRYDGTFHVDLRGNLELIVRTAATGTTLPGCEVKLNYTADYKPKFEDRVLYKMINKATDKSIDLTGGRHAKNASAIQYRYHGGSNQTPYFVSVGENEYKIVMKHSGKVLSPKELNDKVGATLSQSTYSGHDIQKWKLVNLGNDEYQIINVATGYAITANNDRRNITLEKLVHSKKQAWELSYVKNVVVPDVSFRFDGENAGKIMGTDKSMEYTIDGGENWNKITENNMLLPKDEVDAITAAHGIKVRVKDNAGIASIDIKHSPKVPNVQANDSKDKIEGINASMEYSVDDGETWARYSEQNPPTFISDMHVLVRIAGKGVIPPSKHKALSFTSKITIPLHKQFDPMNYIREEDSNKVEVVKNTVDVNKKGIYSLSYKILQGDDETTITKEVEVVSTIDYLSDIDYKSGKSGWKNIKKDTNMYGGSIALHSRYGKEIFKKGITAHADSEIVYDVKNTGYTHFQSYVGIDDTAYNAQSSVIFKVYVDGKLKYDSDVVTSKTPYKYVNIDIQDAKEVKLIVDANGSKTSDHSVWADAKFVSKDSAPVINATNVAYEEEDIINFDDILKKVKATDIEDGDLTSKVTYTTNYKQGKTGTFDIVYSVTDSEGYKTEKTVKLIVVNSSIYVSDTNWVSAKAGWSSTKKDVTINGDPLRLWNGEKDVTYKKGIGTHAYSETIYDLTGKDYGYFTSYVGASRDTNHRGSVAFKVYVDGELVEETDVMKKDTAQEFMKVNIAGAKQLKLVVTDGGNGQGNDSAVWGDAKFLIGDKNVISIDTSKLDEAIEKAEHLKEGDYEKDSWKILQEKLKVGKSVLSNDMAKQNEIDNAARDIHAAITQLQKFKGKSPVIQATDVTFTEGKQVNFDNILAQVTASDVEDGDLTSKITYTTNYEENKVGDFKIEYKVVDSHKNVSTKIVKLTVTPAQKQNHVYLSDIDWVSAKSGWGKTKKDVTIDGSPLRLWDGKKDVTYKKGIGTHAYSETIYDLTGKDYGYFTSYVGVSRKANHRGSVTFKVYVDGELVEETDVMKKDTPQKLIKVNIAGAKQLKLVVTDSGNGQGNDWAIWGDAKFVYGK
ncbi:DUF4073 domain-containing protein [Virgibacillus sp. Bac330]|uniref:DUF4073 domain-containing protein n=1 Tax=Virgibacillus sp. Bac330 TaxID=2419841 RepID=UPI000EF54285|nr:DUF4073 domain-containing protein [Virgibacillus sp. Bac330]